MVTTGRQTTKTSREFDYTNPYLLEALGRLSGWSKQGFSSPILQNMKAQQRRAIGNEASALKMGAQQRLARGGVPTGVQEQALADLDMRRMQAIGSSLADIDFENEQRKLNALGMFGQLSKGIMGKETSKSTTTQKKPMGSFVGDFLGSAIGGIGSIMGGGGIGSIIGGIGSLFGGAANATQSLPYITPNLNLPTNPYDL